MTLRKRKLQIFWKNETLVMEIRVYALVSSAAPIGLAVVSDNSCTRGRDHKNPRSYSSSAMANTTAGGHTQAPVKGAGGGKMKKVGSPEKLLNGFIRLVAVIERLGNALGTLAFTWATVILLGGYPTVLDPKRDFPFATAIVFLEAIRMFSHGNRQDYQLFFSTRGAFTPLGFNGLLTTMVYFSVVLVILRNYYLIHDVNTTLFLIVSMSVLLAIGPMMSPRVLKLLSNLLRRSISLWSPLLAILLMAPCIPQPHYYGLKIIYRNSMTRWILYTILLLFVLLTTISRLRFPCIVKLIDRVVSRKLLAWRQFILNLCMFASIVMLVFTLDGLKSRLALIMLQVIALPLVSLGNFQIPAAFVRVVLASESLTSQQYAADDGSANINNDDGSKRNLKASLNIFYGMVLVQGILYIMACLVEVFSSIPRRCLIQRAGFRGQLGLEYVDHYYAYALEKCMEGAMLAPKRISLVTFAMDSIESDSSKNRLYGVQVLHSLLKKERLRARTISKLTTSTKTVDTLFSMLAWTSHGDAEIRLFAAKVTAELVGSLQIVHIPRAMQLVASLVDTDHHHQPKTRQHFLLNDIQDAREQCSTIQRGEHNSSVFQYWKRMAIYCLIPVDEPSTMDEQSSRVHRCWKMMKWWSIPGEEPSSDQDCLPVQGLLILERLANFDAGNCLEISKATGLISKIIDFTSYRNYETSINNEAQQIILASLSLRVLRRLASTKGKSGVTLRQQIIEHPFISSNLADILSDRGSNHELKELAAEILKHLAMDRNTSENIGHIRVIISNLMHEFLNRGGASSSTDSTHLLRKIAGQALAMLAMESVNNCLVMLMEPGYVFIRELTTMIHDGNYKYTAASLLGNMCEHAQHKLSNSDLNDLCRTLREVLEGIMDAEGAELEVLISLSSQICRVIPEDFARELDHGQIKERFVERLVTVLHTNMRPSAHCPGIRRVIVEHAIHLMEWNSRYANDFHKCWMVEALSMVESTPSMAENYRLLSGDAGLMEHRTPLYTLVARAKELMNREWVRGISTIT
ncbi:hypothetical protein ABZP36_012007 [Zizania latifolia]